MVTFFGNYGSFTVDPDTGIVLTHEPDREEIAANADECGAPFGYMDIVRVDLAERARWYAEHGKPLPAIQPGGDLLDVGFWTATGGYCAPCLPIRRDILAEER